MSEKSQKTRALPQWMMEDKEDGDKRTKGGQKNDDAKTGQVRKLQYVMSPRELEAVAKEALNKKS